MLVKEQPTFKVNVLTNKFHPNLPPFFENELDQNLKINITECKNSKAGLVYHKVPNVVDVNPGDTF